MIQSVYIHIFLNVSHLFSQIAPQIQQLYGNLSAALKEYFDGILDIVAHFAALAQDFFDKHKPELQELTNTLAEIFKGEFFILGRLQKCFFHRVFFLKHSLSIRLLLSSTKNLIFV